MWSWNVRLVGMSQVDIFFVHLRLKKTLPNEFIQYWLGHIIKVHLHQQILGSWTLTSQKPRCLGCCTLGSIIHPSHTTHYGYVNVNEIYNHIARDNWTNAATNSCWEVGSGYSRNKSPPPWTHSDAVWWMLPHAAFSRTKRSPWSQHNIKHPNGHTHRA